MNDWIGACLSIFLVFLLIGFVTMMERLFDISKETSRKMIHIGVGHWIFCAFAWIDDKWIAIFPLVVFILLNVLSLRKNIFAAMETDTRKSLGTVYYPVALLVLTLAYYDTNQLAIAVGTLALAWGDGMAAIIGSRFGKIKYRIYGQTRSLEGSLAMFAGSFLSISLFLYTYAGWDLLSVLKTGFIIALFASVVEAVSYRDFDNLLVPVSTALLFTYLV